MSGQLTKPLDLTVMPSSAGEPASAKGQVTAHKRPSRSSAPPSLDGLGPVSQLFDLRQAEERPHVTCPLEV